MNSWALRCTMAVCITALVTVSALTADDLSVPLPALDGKAPSGMMHRYLMRQAAATLERWKSEYERRKTPQDIAAYQKRLRSEFLKAIGGLPDRTPLNPRITGSVTRPGYRVEKVLLESQPHHYVSALLFLPDAKRFAPPYPGVIVPCGHSLNGKAWPDYQSMGALLALSGMAGLVFDPIDQGERGQYLGKGGWPELGSVLAHCNIGLGCILLGRNTARFEIWDGMRAIDYLQSRPEVDPQRIGCTGNSGGGTQTGYLMALDDRIRCAAPSCWLTGMPRLLATVGCQDAEQTIFGQLRFGLDHADCIMMRAPSPVLVLAATQDFFDISGTWDVFRCAKRLYTRMGSAERVDILENDAPHNYNKTQREGAVRWMSRWLLGEDQPITEPAITLLTEQEYQCTADGKVMSLPEARSVYDLNEDCENALLERRKAAWTGGDRTALWNEVRRVAGIRSLNDLPKPQVESVGTIARTGYRIEKLRIRPEEGVLLPALLFLPKEPKAERVVLYLHDHGNVADAGADGPIERRVRAGEVVLAVELRGTGQTQQTQADLYSPEWQDAALAYILGRSYVGMRAEDVLVCARYAVERIARGRAGSVEIVAVGNVGIPALHAAALEPALIGSIKLSQMLESWSNVVHHRLNKRLVAHVVHGALVHYDLPDLVATLGKKITIQQPINAVGARIGN
jgi:dienelactone hydrolase